MLFVMRFRVQVVGELIVQLEGTLFQFQLFRINVKCSSGVSHYIKKYEKRYTDIIYLVMCNMHVVQKEFQTFFLCYLYSWAVWAWATTLTSYKTFNYKNMNMNTVVVRTYAECIMKNQDRTFWEKMSEIQ